MATEEGFESSRGSKTFALDELLLEKLERALDKPTGAVTTSEIVKIAVEHSAVDLAIIANRLPPEARALLFENLSGSSEQIKFLINTDSSTRCAVFREITDGKIAHLLGQMPPDEAVEVLEDLSQRRWKGVIEALDPDKAARIMAIEKNARNSAGRLMTNEFFSFSMETTVGEVALAIRNHPGIELTSRVFVLGEDQKLVGYVPARILLVNPSKTPLKQVMRSVLHKVYSGQNREEVVEVVERYKISALPVVDKDDRLIGVIAYEDVLDAMQDLLGETIGNVAGTSEKVSYDESALGRFFSRSPWLIVTLCAGLLNVGVMSSFESLQRGILTFALFFVPLITGLSGNIGIQCSTVLVRSMAMGMVTKGMKRRLFAKEFLTGCIAGVVFGILCGFLVYVIDFSGSQSAGINPMVMGSIVGIGLMGACLAGTLLGALSPFFFSKVGIDPAVASGPIVTAFNDFFSMSIYFLIASGLASVLLG